MGDTDLETMANVTIGEYDYEDEAFDGVSDPAKDFVDSLLVRDKEQRSTAEQSLAHPWMAALTAAEATNDESLALEADEGRERKASLNTAKQNLATQREHWEEQKGAHEFLFDRYVK